MLAELSRVLPKDVWLTGMSVDEKGKVDMEGFAKELQALWSLSANRNFSEKVEFVSPILPQDGQKKFSIRLEIAG